MVVLECSVDSLRRYSENSLAALSLCHRIAPPILSELEPDMATSRTVDPPHHRNLKVMVPIECQESEAKLTVEYTFSTSLSLPPSIRNRASDSLGDDEASLVEAHKVVLSSKLRENDSTRPTEPGNTSEDTSSPATRKQMQKLVQGLKEEQDTATFKDIVEATQGDDSKASSSHVLRATETQVGPALSTSQTLRNDANDSLENGKI